MSRGPLSFKLTDLERALKGAEKAGLEVQRYEIVPGKITVFAGKPADPQIAQPANEWDGIK
jgi:hypothetical protein